MRRNIHADVPDQFRRGEGGANNKRPEKNHRQPRGWLLSNLGIRENEPETSIWRTESSRHAPSGRRHAISPSRTVQSGGCPCATIASAYAGNMWKNEVGQRVRGRGGGRGEKGTAPKNGGSLIRSPAEMKLGSRTSSSLQAPRATERAEQLPSGVSSFFSVRVIVRDQLCHHMADDDRDSANWPAGFSGAVLRTYSIRTPYTDFNIQEYGVSRSMSIGKWSQKA